jgi:hypothetical protein
MTFLNDISSDRGISSAIKGYGQETEKFAKDVTEGMTGAIKRRDEKLAAIDKEAEKLDPNVLTPPKIEPFKAPPRTSPLEAFGSAAGVFAALGGLLTRQPLTTSLNAAAKVLDAYKRNDDTAAQTAFDEWKVNTDNAVKLAHFELDAYRAALSKVDSDRAGAYAEVTNLAASFQNQGMAMALQHGGLDEAVKYHEAMQRHADSILEHTPQLEKWAETRKNLKAYDAEVAARKANGIDTPIEEYINEKNRILSGQPKSETAGGAEAEILRVGVAQYARDHPEAPDMPAAERAKLLASTKSGSAAKETPFSRAYAALDEETMRNYGRHPNSDEVAKLNAEVARGESAAVVARKDRNQARLEADSDVRNRVATDTLTLKEKIALENKEVAEEKLALMRQGMDDKRATSEALIRYRNRQEDRKDLEDKLKNEGAKLTDTERASSAAQVATGQPLMQVVPGWGGQAVNARREVRAAAIDLIKKENPEMTDEQAGMELSRRSVAFQAGTRSTVQLTTMLGATRQAVTQLEFNVDRAREEMAKLPSTNLSPIINAIIRGEERWTGDPAYSSLFFYMNAAAMESARLLSGGQASIAQLHEGARAEAEKWANINMTPAMFESVAKAMKAEGHERLRDFQLAIQAQIPGGGGPSPAPAPSSTARPTATDAQGNKVEWDGTNWVPVPR